MTTRLAVAALAGGAVLWWAVYQGSRGADEGRTVLLGVVGILVLVPPALLGRFVLAVRAMIDLPRRLRESPGAVRANLDGLGRRARAVADARPVGPVSTLAAAIRLLRSAASSREVLASLVPGALLLSPAVLAATALAAAAAVVEALIGALALGWLLIR